MTGVRNRVDAFVDWGWDYFAQDRGPQVLDRSRRRPDRLGRGRGAGAA